jgi:hypothetical protein
MMASANGETVVARSESVAREDEKGAFKRQVPMRNEKVRKDELL